MICFQHSTILLCYVNAIVDQWCLAQRCLRTRVCWITVCSIWMRLWAIVVRTWALLSLPLCLRLKGEPASLYGHNCGRVFGLSDQLGHTLGKTVLVVRDNSATFPWSGAVDIMLILCLCLNITYWVGRQLANIINFHSYGRSWDQRGDLTDPFCGGPWNCLPQTFLHNHHMQHAKFKCKCNWLYYTKHF